MTYRELYEKACGMLDNGKINISEWEQMTAPLDNEIEPKTGKWILSDLQSIEGMENGNYYYFCSNCLHGDVHAKTQEVPYCWYCGVRMEGEDDENA